MTASTGVPLRRLVQQLSPALLIDKGRAEQTHRVVRSVMFFETPQNGEEGPCLSDALVLVPVVDRRPTELFAELARADAAAVLLRDSDADSVKLAGQPLPGDLPVLGLNRGASWLHVAQLIAALLEGSHDTHSATGAYDAVTEGLFEQANALADSLQAPVTIEDHACRILAFSDNQADSDEPRHATVLGHKVPDVYQEKLVRSGALRVLYESSEPVFVDCLGPGTRPRTAIRVAAGQELLGSIWVVVDRPLSAPQHKMLTEAANRVAVTLLRRRLAQDSATQMRRAQLVPLLQGGPGAREAAGRLGLPDGGCVLAAQLVAADCDGEAASTGQLERLSGALTTVLRAVSPRALATVLDSTVYGLLPGGAGAVQLEHVRAMLDRSFARRQAESAPTVRIGVGGHVEDAAEFHRSRREAELVLRVLRSRRDTGHRGEVSTLAAVHTDSLLQRVADVLAADREQVSGPMARLREHDAVSNAPLESTLRAWLDAFGNVPRAAADLHIHQNTLRYRLRRIGEVTGMDLDDPDQRFGVMLQMRLFQQ